MKTIKTPAKKNSMLQISQAFDGRFDSLITGVGKDWKKKSNI